MPERSGRVAVVGSYVQDHAWFCDLFPRDGESRRAHRFNTGPGGKGFNQAVACHRQGVATVFIGALGDDHLGAIARRFAAEEGLEAHWQSVDAPNAASSILVDARGANRIVVSLGANERLDPAFVRERLASARDARIVLCQLENGLDAIAAALEAGTAAGALRMLNPAPMHPRLDPALLAHVDVATPNETEFALLLQHCAVADVDPDAIAPLDDATLHALARRLPVPTVVVTLGAQGCFVSHGTDLRGDAAPFYRIAAEPVHAIDTTGAGDAFSGALAAALVRFDGAPFAHSARHANRAAALSTETVGTAPAMPSWHAIAARFGGAY